MKAGLVRVLSRSFHAWKHTKVWKAVMPEGVCTHAGWTPWGPCPPAPCLGEAHWRLETTLLGPLNPESVPQKGWTGRTVGVSQLRVPRHDTRTGRARRGTDPPTRSPLLTWPLHWLSTLQDPQRSPNHPIFLLKISVCDRQRWRTSTQPSPGHPISNQVGVSSDMTGQGLAWVARIPS